MEIFQLKLLILFLSIPIFVIAIILNIKNFHINKTNVKQSVLGLIALILGIYFGFASLTSGLDLTPNIFSAICILLSIIVMYINSLIKGLIYTLILILSIPFVITEKKATITCTIGVILYIILLLINKKQVEH